MSIQEKLKAKIKEDCGLDIAPDAQLVRRTLTWSQATAGQMKWYWINPSTIQTENGTLSRSLEEFIIGSSEGMKELLKCKKIEWLHHAGQTELSSS